MKDNQLVTILKKDLFTTSKEVAEGTHVAHRSIQKNINKYCDDFKELGKLDVISNRTLKGQVEVIYYLNEPQSTYLITLLRNTNTVRGFKLKLIKEFFKMRKVLNSIIVRQDNSEWQEKRRLGISTRKDATDTIAEFIEYAKKQGSKSAQRYFVNYSKLENSTLFILGDMFKIKKKPNVRNHLTNFQLNNIEVADRIIEKAINDGMKDELYYKEIYKLAKKRLTLLSEHLGKSHVPELKNHISR